jgi:hypothetical protein
LSAPSAEQWATQVEASRIASRCLELVEQHSPTGDTARVAELFGQRLSELGLEVELRTSEVPPNPHPCR